MAVELVYTCERDRLKGIRVEALPRVMSFDPKKPPRALDLCDGCHKEVPLAEAIELWEDHGRHLTDEELSQLRKAGGDIGIVWPCPVPTCNRAPGNRGALRTHLRDLHDMSMTDAREQYGKLNRDGTWSGQVGKPQGNAKAEIAELAGNDTGPVTEPGEDGLLHCPSCEKTYDPGEDPRAAARLGAHRRTHGYDPKNAKTN